MNDSAPDGLRRDDLLRSRRLGYAAAVAAVAAATLVRLALDRLFGDGFPFTTYFLAAALIAGFGRTREAVLTLVGGGLLGVYLFAPPRHSFPVTDPNVLLGLSIYLTVGGVIVVMSHAMRVARGRAEALLTGAAEQRERLRTTLASIGDAVITTDTAGRVTNLNPVAEALTGWATADAAGRPLDAVFVIVNETTRQPVENPAFRALKAGVIVGLANHTVLVARDGAERPIDDSAAPIRSKEGEVVGSVLVFRDVTERRRAESLLVDQNAVLQQMLRGGPLADVLEALCHAAEAQTAQGGIATVLLADAGGTLLRPAAGRRAPAAYSEAIDPVPVGPACGSCGTAAYRGEPVVVSDIAADPLWADFRDAALPHGLRACWSIPIPSSAGAVLGTFAIYSTVPRSPTDHDLRVMEFLARTAGLAVERQRADEAVREAHSRLGSTLAAGEVGTWEFDVVRNTVRADANLARMFGVVPGEAAGGPLDAYTRAIHPDDRGRVVGVVERAIQAGDAYEADYRLVGPGGAVRWVVARGRVERDGAGRAVRLPGVVVDITQQRQAEESLRAIEERLRLAVAAAKLGQWNLDLRTREMTCSDGCRANYGRRPGDQFTYDDLWATVHPDDRERVRAAVRRAVETRTDYDTEYRVVWPDGSLHWVLVRGQVRYAPDGTPLDMTGVTLDITDRRVGEERLRASEAFNRSLMDGSADCVKVLDLDGRLLAMNTPGLCTMEIDDFGSVCGRDWSGLWPADARRQVDEAVFAARSGVNSSFQAFCPTAKGTPRWWDVSVSPVRNTADGPVVRVLAVSRDITDRKRDEERLRANEERNSFLVTLADTLRPLSDPTAVQAEASRVLGERLGASRVVYFEVRGDEYVVERDYAVGVRSVVGRHTIAAFGPDQLALYRAGRTAAEADVDALPARPGGEKAAFAGVQIRSYIGVPLVKNGVFVAGLAVHSDRVRAWTPTEIAVTEDTAERTWAAVERVRAEAALRTSEEQRRLALESAESGAWNIDPAANALTSDERFRVITHGSTTPITYEQAFAAIHPDDRGRVRDAVAAATRPGSPAPYAEEYRVVHPDGAVRWVFGKGRANFERPAAGRRPVSFDGTVTDVTARKQVEEERDALVAELQDHDRRKDEFLATLAHELRNPLAPIRNGLQLIGMAGANGVVEQARTMMDRQLTQLVRLVDDLLDVSRITRGKLDLRRERIDLRAVIDAAVETARPLIEQAGHDLAVAVPDEPVFVDGDATRLAQVVSNLLTNSAKYTHRGGHIRLSVRRDDNRVCVSVADDGIGIPPAMLDTVFVMFTQVDRTLEKTTGGLGIGLSLVKGLVEMHGGTVEARSAGEGRGSEFVVTLPVAVPVAGGPDEAGRTADEIVSPGRRRVLVVDDNADAADSLAQLLELLGNEVRTAYDGEAGVAAATEFRPGVVLMDLGMPRLNGYDAARRIRQQPWGKTMALVALTGWGQEDDRRKTAEAGFDHHIVKPVEAAALMKLLAGLEPAK